MARVECLVSCFLRMTGATIGGPFTGTVCGLDFTPLGLRVQSLGFRV